jgi:siroheme synthase
LRLALEGRTVVRLKGGDPAVFGRLSEELGPVREAGIRVEIVPGVTAAAAAAAAAGIPLTSRSAASSLTILTGHEASEKREGIDFQSIAALPGTLAIYMGVEQVERWSKGLLSAGKPSDTPVTIVSHCSWPDQRIAVSTLARCAADFKQHDWPAPAVVIVGEVAQPVDGPSAVAIRGPLAGRRVLNTRPAAQGDDVDALVRARQRQRSAEFRQPPASSRRRRPRARHRPAGSHRSGHSAGVGAGRLHLRPHARTVPLRRNHHRPR